MKAIITITLLGCAIISHSQTTTSDMQPKSTQVTDIDVGPSDYSILYAVNTFANLYEDRAQAQALHEEAETKLRVLKDTYASYQTVPDSIVSGWHNVIATDNYMFCREAKVYVKNNRIADFVIDNCIRPEFTSPGKIRNAKGLVTIVKANELQMSLVDVYFIYDMEEPTFATEPIEPGYVCFWTKRYRYTNREILLNQIPIEGLYSISYSAPDCPDPSATSVTLKPGVYKLRVAVPGNDLQDTIEIKSGEYLQYELK